MKNQLLSFITLVLIGINSQVVGINAQTQEDKSAQKIVEQGIAIEFAADPLAQNAKTIKAGR